MKKNFLLIFISLLILSAPVYVLAGGSNDDNAENNNSNSSSNVSAQPLTCSYGSNKTYAIRLIQNSNGSFETAQIAFDEWQDVNGIDLNATKWRPTSAKITWKFNLENGVLSSCPKSVDRNLSGDLTFYSTNKGDYKLAKWEPRSVTEDKAKDEEAGLNTEQHFTDVHKNNCSEKTGEFPYICRYEGLVNICFNEKDWEFEFASPEAQMYYLGVSTDFYFSKFLQEYHANGNVCPQIFSSEPEGPADNDLHISIENSNREIEDETNLGPRLNYDSLCSNDGIRNAVKIIGYVLKICKWVGPLVIIVLGMIDYVKAVVSNDEKSLSKATSSLIKRIVGGIVAIFIPTLIMAVLNAIKITNEIDDVDFGACTTCLFDPSNCGAGMDTGN